ncbi:MAG: PAS domain-containing protein [Myxococcota bacterium]
MTEPTDRDEHYLKRELYTLVQERSEVFEFLQAGSLDGIWYWDMESPEHEWLSPRFKALFGYAEEEMDHTPEWWQANIHPDDLKAALANYEAHAADPNHPYDQVVRYRHKDGSTVWVRCRGMAIRDADGRPIRMLGAHTDVTAIKEAELRLQTMIGTLKATNEKLQTANARLQARNEDLEQFRYIVGHDLQPPLRGIDAYAGFLREDFGDRLGEEGLALVEKVEGSSKRMKALLDGLLAYAKVAGTHPVFEPVPLDEVVHDVLMDYDAALQALDAEVEVDALPVVHGSRAELESVFSNLVGNAIKYRSLERSMHLHISNRRVAEGWELSVADNGIGFAPELFDRARKVFVQLHPRGEYSGVGLGLSLVDKVLWRHQSELRAESALGRGTTFRFVLPGSGA